MAFVKKTWKDRIVQYANRRLLTKSGGEVEQVTVTRDEGTISEAGDQFNASNMNDLEQRVKDGFDGLNASDIEYSSGVTVKQAIDNRYTKTETDTELAKKCNYVNLGTGSIHDFLTNTNYPKGIYIVECMRSPDSPTTGYVSFAIIDKPQDAGGYSNIMVNGQGHLYTCLVPSAVPSTLTFNLLI